MNRRDAIKAGGAVVALTFTQACESVGSKPPRSAPIVGPLIDAHCHIFNGSDLPSVRFIKIVILAHYRKQGMRTLEIDDPDALDGLLELFTFIVGSTRAPTAAQEIAVLRDARLRDKSNVAGPTNDALVIKAIAEFAAQERKVTGTSVPSKAREVINKALLKAAGESGIGMSSAAPLPSANLATAQKAYRSSTDIGIYLRWFALFTQYRHTLAEDLASTHLSEGFPARLLCPALIDYDLWLRESVDRSPLPAQVSVMGALARRKTGPVVHGYVAFDPLRQAYFDAGKKAASFDPLALVRRAITEEGFLGVKLYPPMGFKASGNSADSGQMYDEDIICDLSEGKRGTDGACEPKPPPGSVKVGEKLDAAMDRLFAYCATEGACVMAHATESHGSGPSYAKRADPAFWIPVFEKYPTLRVSLAHFGHFENRSAAAPQGSVFPEASWEWTLGRYIRAKANPPIFADISYLSEIFGKSSTELSAYATTFKAWIKEFDPQCEHVMFGTDWTMLGLESFSDNFTLAVHRFFKHECGFEDAMLERLFLGNATRFLGLREGDATRQRLVRFYATNQIPVSRLPPG